MHNLQQECSEGWLSKRSTRTTLAIWQRRYFRISIEDRIFAYYRSSKCVFPQFFISLHDILDVKVTSTNPARFDIITNVKRVLHLDANSANEARKWISSLAYACRTVRDLVNDASARVNNTVDPPNKSFICFPKHHTSITPLRVAFLQLNYSLSSVNQRDFFRDIVQDFKSDVDVLSFIIDVTLYPNTNSHTADAIRLSRHIENDHHDTSKQISRTPQSSALRSSDSTQVGLAKLQIRPGRRRSNSDCSIEVSAYLKAHLDTSVHDDDLQCIEHLSTNNQSVKNYALLHSAASRVNTRSVLNPRARVVAWLQGDEALQEIIHTVSHQPRLGLTALYILLLSRHHEDELPVMQIPRMTVNTLSDSRTLNEVDSVSQNPANNTIFYSGLVGSEQTKDESDQFLSPTARSPSKQQAGVRTSPISKQDSRSTQSSKGSPANKGSADHSFSDVCGSRHWGHQAIYSCHRCCAASDEFVRIIQTMPKSHVSSVHTKVLLSMLCVSPVDFGTISQVYNEKHNVFNKIVINTALWPALFAMTFRANPLIQRDTLKECSGLLLGTDQNCEGLIQLTGWQSWFMQFCNMKSTIVRATTSLTNAEEQACASTRKYSHNLLSLLHFHILLHRPPSTFMQNLSSALSLCNSKQTKHILLLAMVQRICSKLRNRSLTLTDRWSAVRGLLALVLNHVLGSKGGRTSHIQCSVDDDRDLIDRCVALMQTTHVIAKSYDETVIVDTQDAGDRQAITKIPCTQLCHVSSSSTILMTTISTKPNVESNLYSLSEQDQIEFALCQHYAASMTDLNALLSILVARKRFMVDILSPLNERRMCEIFTVFASHEAREKIFAIVKLDSRTE